MTEEQSAGAVAPAPRGKQQSVRIGSSWLRVLHWKGRQLGQISNTGRTPTLQYLKGGQRRYLILADAPIIVVCRRLHVHGRVIACLRGPERGHEAEQRGDLHAEHGGEAVGARPAQWLVKV